MVKYCVELDPWDDREAKYFETLGELHYFLTNSKELTIRTKVLEFKENKWVEYFHIT